ncbi:MAG TPA: ABC transporter permease [Alphaproteobacteria bacterium]|nr:ABC transporter permease [Alphaproteobacteria bacterium]
MTPPARAAVRPAAPRAIGRVHWMGLWTLYAREMRRYLKEWLETIVASGFSTILYLAVFAFALGPDRDTPEGQAVLAFILPGLVLFAILNRAAETTVFSIVFDKLEGMIVDVQMPPLTPSEVTAAYALAGTATGLITGLPIVLVAILFFGLRVEDPALFVLFGAGGALMLSLTGILVGIWSRKWDHAAAFFGFVLIPLTFVSGLFAPIEDLPEPLALAVRMNPIFYVIDGFRAACIGLHSAPVALSAVIVLAVSAGLWIVCDRLIASGWRMKA